MRRREFITLLGGAGAAAWPLAARAQQRAVPVIGFLDLRSSEAVASRLRGFRQGLKESGHVEGETVTIVYRLAEDRSDRLQELAADLVDRRVDVIATAGSAPSITAKAATAVIPVVFVVPDDPVRLGLVSSFSRPSGNVTGVNVFTAELAAKRLALLRELVPRAARIAVLVNPADAASESQLKEVRTAADALGLKLMVYNADSSADIDAAFETIGRERPDAIFIGASATGQCFDGPMLLRPSASRLIPFSGSRQWRSDPWPGAEPSSRRTIIGPSPGFASDVCSWRDADEAS
jgi:ABC-type uncharacterized transport system substrate-binding protein